MGVEQFGGFFGGEFHLFGKGSDIVTRYAHKARVTAGSYFGIDTALFKSSTESERFFDRGF